MKNIEWINKIKHGDAFTILKQMPNNFIDCCITSPPYWALRDYGTANWEGGEKDCDHVANHNATKKFGNTEFNKKRPSREEIKTSHYYKDICPKCGAKRIDKQIGLESTFQEYITKLCDIFDEIKRVLKNTGTCWVNLGDTYGGNCSRGSQGTRAGFGKEREGVYIRGREKTLTLIPSRFAIEMCNRGWILRNELIWQKPNAMPSSATDRFTVDFEKIFFFVKNKKYKFNTQIETYIEPMNRWGGNKLKADGESTWDMGTGQSTYRNRNLRPNENGRNKRCVWRINTKPFKEAHFAVFPEKLITTPIKAGCPVGGIVLDPFGGSMTTCVVAKKLNRNYIAIELNSKYIEIGKKRVLNTMTDLF